MSKSLSMSLQSLFVLSICTVACQKESISDNPDTAFYNVDQRLWSYFESFEREAYIRGLNIDLASHNLSGHISNISDDGVAGVCRYSQGSRDITVDSEYWNRAGLLNREFVIFHELGHCVLGRGHEEGSFSNGICVSIMRSGLGECRDANSQGNREYYLDELFSETSRN